MDLSGFGIDDDMDMRVKFDALVNHVKAKCKINLKEGNPSCKKCAFLPWVMIIMDVYKWEYHEVYK